LVVVDSEADDKSRVPLASNVNLAVHLDNVGGTEFSADRPATITDLIGRFKGPDMVTVYTSGCCGDINHIDVRWAEPQTGHANAERIGTILWAALVAQGPLVLSDRLGYQSLACNITGRGSRVLGRPCGSWPRSGGAGS
jgi:hypothetical protein